jgi:hypothetical protein
VTFLDAIACKVHDQGVVRDKAAYQAAKHVLCIWIDTAEGRGLAQDH